MKRPDFLKKLHKKRKLQLVDSSEEIKSSYLEKSDSNLISAKLLFENDRLEEAVSLAYYSMYHIITALLFKIGIKCENHTGSIKLIKKIFDIDNSDIEFAKKERVDKQYYTDFHITKKEVDEMIKIAEEFTDQILDFISKLNNSEIKDYRKKFRELFD